MAFLAFQDRFGLASALSLGLSLGFCLGHWFFHSLASRLRGALGFTLKLLRARLCFGLRLGLALSTALPALLLLGGLHLLGIISGAIIVESFQPAQGRLRRRFLMLILAFLLLGGALDGLRVATLAASPSPTKATSMESMDY